MLEVADNSVAKKAKCIQVLGPQKVAKLGDTIVLTVKEVAPNGAVKKGQVRHGVVVRSALQSSRFGGFGIKFDHNAVILIDSKTKKERGQHSTKNKRKKGDGSPRKTKHTKILSSAKSVILGMDISGNFGMLGTFVVLQGLNLLTD